MTIILKGFFSPKKINIFYDALERKRVISGFLIITGFILLIQFLGFFISSLIFIASMHSYLNTDKMNASNVLLSVCQSALITTLAYYLFSKLLLVPLPIGIIFNF